MWCHCLHLTAFLDWDWLSDWFLIPALLYPHLQKWYFAMSARHWIVHGTYSTLSSQPCHLKLFRLTYVDVVLAFSVVLDSFHLGFCLSLRWNIRIVGLGLQLETHMVIKKYRISDISSAPPRPISSYCWLTLTRIDEGFKVLLQQFITSLKLFVKKSSYLLKKA